MPKKNAAKALPPGHEHIGSRVEYTGGIWHVADCHQPDPGDIRTRVYTLEKRGFAARPQITEDYRRGHRVA